MQQLLLLLLTATCPATPAERQGFTVCYDSTHQRALWTKHEVKPATAPSARKHWRIDHELNSLPSAAFTHSGFHRGHLASAADIPDSPDAFLTSNAVPQDPSLNTGSWRRLENQIRKRGPASVVTGAIYGGCGNDRIEAPCYLFKIAFHADGTITAALAPNAPRHESE